MSGPESRVGNLLKRKKKSDILHLKISTLGQHEVVGREKMTRRNSHCRHLILAHGHRPMGRSRGTKRRGSKTTDKQHRTLTPIVRGTVTGDRFGPFVRASGRHLLDPIEPPTALIKAKFPLLKVDRKSTRLNSSHPSISRMPSSA